MASMLTEDQKKRMEESRQKALAKRAAALASKNNPTIANPSAFVSNPTPAVSSYQNSSTAAKNTSTLPQTNFYKPFTAAANSSSAAASSSFNKPAGNIQKPSDQQQWKIEASGGCFMISRDRFVVNIGYHSKLIEVFKSIAGGMYDAQTKKWSFPTSEHGNLMTALSPLKSVVAVGPLPPFVLKVFRSLGTQRKSEIDNNMLSKIDQQLVTALFEYQKEGICFGIRNNGRCLIADDMGLGKTLQALGIAHYYYAEWPLLIATASSLRYVWKEALWKWLPTVPAGSIVVAESSKDYIQFAKVVIISYDLLNRRQEEFKNMKVVIIDESHHLKNFKTARSKAALPIVQKASRAVMLSGTPALSRPIELYSQLVSLNRNIMPTYEEYGFRYCNGKKNNWGLDFTGFSNMEELNLLLRETIMIRRMKSDVLAQLPPKRRKTIPLDLGLSASSDKCRGLKMTQAAFAKAKQNNKSESHGCLLQYFVETAKVKVGPVVNYVKDLIEQDKKFLLFAHHTEMLDGVSRALDSMKVKYIRIDGTTSSEERHYLCDQFQYEQDIKVAVLSIMAANVGITLTAAHLVVFAELYWNPGVLTQAEDRVHRIGQQDSVLVEYLVGPGTCDDVLWAMVSDKLDILNKVGLSKDNFREADVEVLKTKQPQQQRGINEFFPTVVPSTKELEDLFKDDFNDDDDFVMADLSMSDDNPVSPAKKTKY